MTSYILYLYDKDNDMYENAGVYGQLEPAETVAQALADLIKQDMIINRYNDRTEPFDWVEIVKFSDDTVPTGERVAVYPEK